MRGKIITTILIMAALISVIATAPSLDRNDINSGFDDSKGAYTEKGESNHLRSHYTKSVLSRDVERQVPHFAIHIDGNDDFTKMLKGVTGGSGTADDPYVIANWYILPRLLPGIHPLIHIENTNAHFIIRNCYIHGVHIDNIIWNNGIYLHNVSNGNIEKCLVEKCFTPIWIHNSTHNRVENCYVKKNHHGIYMRRSSHNVVRNCECENSTLDGITISWGNDPYNEYEHIPSSYNTIENCVCHGMYGYDEFVGAGIYLCCLSNSTGNKILNCTSYDNEYGVLLHNWIYNTTVTDCTLFNNKYGLRVCTGKDNHIHHNAFIDNKWQAWDPQNDMWCDISCKEGNYWNDYEGVDTNGDGVGDTPYKIPGGNNIDWYPLMKPPTFS